eukprot:1136584-Pelagomonas_calceolata.AAC.1
MPDAQPAHTNASSNKCQMPSQLTQMPAHTNARCPASSSPSFKSSTKMTDTSDANKESLLTEINGVMQPLVPGRKCLTVITQQSGVICFNSEANSLPPLLYDGDSLPYTDSFKYLGMVCDKRLNLSTAAEAALKPCIAGTYHVQVFANDHNLTIWLHASIWLSETNATPAGIVWQPGMGYTLLTAGHRKGQPVAEVDSIQGGLLNVLRNRLEAGKTVSGSSTGAVGHNTRVQLKFGICT